MIIDTHCHLYDPQFDADRAEVVRRAREAGVEWMVLPNEDCTTVERLVQTEAEFPGFCRAAIGLHPESVKDDYRQQLAAIRRLIDSRQWVAIGEVGMDLYWDKTYAAEQEDAFRQQAEWAVELDLPIIIHTRKAWEETFRSIRQVDGRLRGVFHCFSGSAEIAQEIARIGDFCLGIGGVLTFKNSGLGEVLKSAPLDRIVLETDAPYLAPVPHRGTRNESAYLKEVVGKLSEIYQTTPEEVEKVTSNTAKTLFGAPESKKNAIDFGKK